MNVRVQCTTCGKTQDSQNPKHILKDLNQMSKGIMTTLLIPARECKSCGPEIRAREGYYEAPLLLRFPSACHEAG